MFVGKKEQQSEFFFETKSYILHYIRNICTRGGHLGILGL